MCEFGYFINILKLHYLFMHDRKNKQMLALEARAIQKRKQEQNHIWFDRQKYVVCSCVLLVI